MVVTVDSAGRRLRDPWHELLGAPPEPPPDLRRTALVTIDLQYFDAHPEGWMARVARQRGQPGALDERWRGIAAILPNVAELQDACRNNGMEVIHVRVAHLTRDRRDGPRSGPTHMIHVSPDGRDDEFLPEVAPKGDEIVISKTTASAFNSTNIDQVLRNIGVDRLWVSGVVTQGCVELTARDAADRGYFTTLVTDGCASSTSLLHEDALARMSNVRLIYQRSTAQLLAEFNDARQRGAAVRET